MKRKNTVEERLVSLELNMLRETVRSETLHGLINVLAGKCGIGTEEIEGIYKEIHKKLYDNMYCQLEQHDPELAGYLYDVLNG